MRKFTTLMLALGSVFAVLLASPERADAAIRLGADVLWMPIASQSVEDGEASLDSDHDIASFGFSGHGNLGFDIFSLGLKVNYINQGIEFAAQGVDEEVRHEQVDLNLMARVGLPVIDLAVVAEAGATTNPGLDFFGYNAGGGLEYALFGIPTLDLNVGAMGQYVKVTEVEDFAAGQESDVSTVRGLLYIGADFSL